jgi:hypothetical protein
MRRVAQAVHVAPTQVLASRHGLEMRRVDAQSIAAQMVKV